jgi:multidrug efflux pump subunit AcrA (membrane-fusion protein)
VGETVPRGQGAGQEAAGGHAEDLTAVETGGAGRRHWVGWGAAGVLVVLAAGVVLSAWRDGVFSPVPSPGSTGQGTPAPATAAVTRQDMAAITPVNATLGYAGSYLVTGRSGGTLTWLPSPGQVIRQGQVLYRIDNGTPVVLLYGPVPDWRALRELMTGQDVAQLNHDLVALGDADSADISFLGWDYFSWETKAGVQRLQSALGVSSPSGSLPLGQVVFEPEAIRVSQVTGSLGGPANGPVLTATSDRHLVMIQLSTSRESEVAVGNAVTVTLPDGASTPGRISSVGTVVSGTASNATIPVTVRLVHSSAAGLLDQAPVTVNITTVTAHDVLAVPVTALLAQASGGYAVEVVGLGNTRRWVPVTTGIFDDAGGLVQVTGSLVPGQRVVVAAS